LSDDEVLSLMRTVGLYVHASTHRDCRGNFHAKPELLGLAPLEALSTGAPTFVSNAGALPELAALPGCEMFWDDGHLARMLCDHAAGISAFPPSSVIAAEVEKQYGLSTFGNAFLAAALRVLR
jgi:hypothetical protein